MQLNVPLFQLLIFPFFLFPVQPIFIYTLCRTNIFLKLRLRFYLLFRSFCISSKSISLYCLLIIRSMDRLLSSKFRLILRLLLNYQHFLFDFLSNSNILISVNQEIHLNFRIYSFVHVVSLDLEYFLMVKSLRYYFMPNKALVSGTNFLILSNL